MGGREGLGLCSGADAGGFAAGSGEAWRRRRSLYDVKAFGQEHWKKIALPRRLMEAQILL